MLPLSVPLPRGKKLHLGPGKTGQIAANAVDYAPLKKLVDAGELEIVDETQARAEGLADGKGPAAPTQGHGASGVIRRSGDR